VTPEPKVPSNGTVVASSDSGDCRTFDSGPIALPGEAAREQWRLVWFPHGTFRWRTTFPPAEVGLEALATHAVRVFDVVVLWSVRDVCSVVRSRVLNLERDVRPRLVMVANRLSRSIHGGDDLVWRVSFGAVLQRELTAIGLDADVVVQPRLSTKVAFSPEASRVLQMMSTLRVHDQWHDLLHESGPLYPRIRHMLEDLGAGAFVRRYFAQLFETQRVLGLAADAAGDVTMEAFGRLFFVWDVAREEDRLPLLATAAVQAMRELGFGHQAELLHRAPSATTGKDKSTPRLEPTFPVGANERNESGWRDNVDRLELEDLQESRYEYSDVPLR